MLSNRVKSLSVIVLITVFAFSCALFAETASQSAGKTEAAACGSGCGAAAPATAPTQVNLTDAQKKQLAAIDGRCKAELSKLRPRLEAKGKELSKLVGDPKSDNKKLRTAMHEYADIQADCQLAQLLASRAKDNVYTQEQKKLLGKQGGCGCGSGGGCGSSGGCGG